MRHTIDDKTHTELEAAAFRRLVQHLRERTDVQNIDLMNLAGFCRNCLSRWYREEAGTRGIEIADPKAREIVYGMPYDEWRAKFQKEASGDQKKAKTVCVLSRRVAPVVTSSRRNGPQNGWAFTAPLVKAI